MLAWVVVCRFCLSLLVVVGCMLLVWYCISNLQHIFAFTLKGREEQQSNTNTMTSTTKHVVSQLKEDLLKEYHKNNTQSSPSHDSDERILDVLNRLDELNIDVDILKETLIGKTVNQFKKKYSEDITIKARALIKKWKRIYEDATSTAAASTAQNNDAEMKERGDNNDVEGNYKSDDDNNRETSNADGNDSMSTPNSPQRTQVGFCDICSKPANFRENIGQLQRCKDCGICVHELCYCTVPTSKIDPNFTCHACKAVNTNVEVNVPSRIGGTGEDMGKKRELMTVEKRPMECVLCVHSSECHAMHPLYDTCGKEGRQYVLKASGSGKPRRLAWVHTLCAQMLIQTKGYLYGCDKDGDWYSSNNINDEDENSEDNESARKSSPGDSEDEEVGGQKYKLGTRIYKEFRDEQTGKDRFFKGRVIRFDKRRKFYKIVYTDGDEEEMTESQVKKYLQKPTKATKKKAPVPVSVATRNFCFGEDMKDEIKEARKLKCAVCRRDDTKSLRIPTQCNVGDEGVHTDLQQHYSHVTGTCTTAMHVGCELTLNFVLFHIIARTCANQSD